MCGRWALVATAAAALVGEDTKMEEYGESQDGDLANCRICGRNFFSHVIKKHMSICQKSNVKKRKVFDSFKQRADGTDIPSMKPFKAKPEPPKKESNWRRTHEDFIATIRAAKGLNKVLKEGGPLPPPPPPTYNPDYIQCPYCQRRFNETAAERHINFCREQAARLPKGKLSVDTKPKYKPPQLKKASSPPVVAAPLPGSSASSSRLPQRQSISGVAPPMSSPGSSMRKGSSGTNGSGVMSPPSGMSMRVGSSNSPGSLKNTSYARGSTQRKVSGPNGSHSKSGLDQSSTQQPKFCHECGAKYAVGSAKFCSECGVRKIGN